MMIVNGNSGNVNKLGASLTDDARVVIYDCHMFIQGILKGEVSLYR